MYFFLSIGVSILFFYACFCLGFGMHYGKMDVTEVQNCDTVAKNMNASSR